VYTKAAAQAGRELVPAAAEPERTFRAKKVKRAIPSRLLSWIRQASRRRSTPVLSRVFLEREGARAPVWLVYRTEPEVASMLEPTGWL
jgi:hypothetical protein